jgi:hypothetical protein
MVRLVPRPSGLYSAGGAGSGLAAQHGGRPEVAHLIDAVIWAQSDEREAERRRLTRDQNPDSLDMANKPLGGAPLDHAGWMAEEIPFLAAQRTRSSSVFAGAAHLVRDLDRGERSADDQLRERIGDLAVGLQVGLDVLLHGERHVRMDDPLPERLQSIFGRAPC